MYIVEAKSIGSFDVAVCGGGIAGACAAISAAREGAKVILIEKSGSLGGTLTEGYMPIILDSDNKGGLVRELYGFLNEHDMTCARRGKPVDESGKKIPGQLVDTEGCKYFFEKKCIEAGVEILFHSQVMQLKMNEKSIDSILVATECGNYSVSASIYIDATGNGVVADFAGCAWDCGDPVEKKPSPASMGISVVGFPEDYPVIDTKADKAAYGEMLKKHGISISSEEASVRQMPPLAMWGMGINFQYDVYPDDIFSLSKAVLDGRKEVFEVIDAHRKIEGFENLFIAFTNSHIGIREGRRIYGKYRLTDEDIIEGRKFEDAVCLVRFGVDVHKLKADDTTECSRGVHTQPYHIPYRSLVPLGCDNLLLAGRCISGDFYPHASYRVMGNMAATGEAAGFAAANCVKFNTLPAEYNGKEVCSFMKSRKYEI